MEQVAQEDARFHAQNHGVEVVSTKVLQEIDCFVFNDQFSRDYLGW